MKNVNVIIATKNEHAAAISGNTVTCGDCEYWRQDGIAVGGYLGDCAIRLYKSNNGRLANMNTNTWQTCGLHETKFTEVK